MVSPSTGWSRHDHDVAAAEKYGDGLDISRQTTNKKHGGIAQSSFPQSSARGSKGRGLVTHDIETSGEVEQTSERSTCAMRVSYTGSE
jgi:hypothetical protein